MNDYEVVSSEASYHLISPPKDCSMKLPKVSVITPCFNHAQFVDATMRSIHGQRYPNLEHIVIDGGSTDGSVAIIDSYRDRLAYWVSEPDDGQTDALIKGFDRATGDIYCWLNSDDLFEPNTLQEVAEYFAANPEVQFVYGDSRWINATAWESNTSVSTVGTDLFGSTITTS